MAPKLLPIIILLVVLLIVASVGFVVYTIATDIKANTKKKMEKKHIMLSKEGVKVHVKEVSQESYADRTQR